MLKKRFLFCVLLIALIPLLLLTACGGQDTASPSTPDSSDIYKLNDVFTNDYGESAVFDSVKVKKSINGGFTQAAECDKYYIVIGGEVQLENAQLSEAYAVELTFSFLTTEQKVKLVFLRELSEDMSEADLRLDGVAGDIKGRVNFVWSVPRDIYELIAAQKNNPDAIIFMRCCALQGGGKYGNPLQIFSASDIVFEQ